MHSLGHNLGKKTWRPIAGLVALVTMALVLASPGTSGAATQATDSSSPVVAQNDAGMMKSKVRGTTDDGRKVVGSFTPSSFEMAGDKLMANGTLDMVLRGKGKPQSLPSQDVSLEVVGANAPGATAGGGKGMPGAAAVTCDILNLVLGPLDLNLLGLEIHLDTVVLDIIANPAGGLLGQLLCGVANLLSTGPLAGLLTQLQALLTQILGVLGGLGL